MSIIPHTTDQSDSTDLERANSPPEHTLAKLSDADLLDAWHQDSSRAALAVLVDRCAAMVLSVCRRRCRSASDAEDAFQSTFLYLARSSSKIRRPSRLAGWLHRVAQRAAVATLRLNEHPNQPLVDTPADPDDPLDRLAQRHDATLLDEELSNLPEHYRTALVLHLLDGRSYQALAEEFGTTIGAVRGHVQRGKRMLASRLRRRGVVPVLAYAAAGAWAASRATAAAAAVQLTDSSPSGDLPDPPIDPSLLESLLAKGTHLMPSVYLTGSILGGLATLALMMLPGAPTNGQSPDDRPVVTLPAQNGAAEAPLATVRAANSATANPRPSRSAEKPTSKIAAEISGKLDETFDSAGPARVGLDQLPEWFASQLGIPVLLDERAMEIAQVDSSTQVQVDVSKEPLRTALRRALQQLGLQAVVEDEGLVITADYTELARQGINTERWLDISPELDERFEKALNEKISFTGVELPLEVVIRQLIEQTSTPMMIDEGTLEEVGLTSDTPVSANVQNVTVRSLLNLLLNDLDLTYEIDDEVLKITSVDAANRNLRYRIYWLEGTGIPRGDFDSIMTSIRSTVMPETWEQLGGPSTMTPLQMGDGNRPSLLISTTDEVHHQIKNLLDVLRKTHTGSDPVAE